MSNYITYIISFILVYLFYLLFVLVRPKQLEKFKTSSYIVLLVKKYKIDLKSVNFKILAHTVCLGNSFILSTVLFAISWFKNPLFIILVGLITMIIITFLVYHIIGSMYRKKEK